MEAIGVAKSTKRCWAMVLGDCDGGLTREHLVSECVTPKKVSVRGLPWCKTELKTVGVGSLTGHILCQRHNNDLSVVDQEIKSFKQTILEVDNHPSTTEIKGGRLYMNLDGRLLARWLAKTYCNFLTAQDHFVEPELVRFCFGRSSKKSPQVWVPVWKGLQLKLNNDHILGLYEWKEDTGGFIAEMPLFGFPWLLTSLDLPRKDFLNILEQLQIIPHSARRSVLPNPPEISFEIGAQKYRVIIRWGTRRNKGYDQA
ncbi:MAG: hypothetical protein AABZ47_09440 [Planctomycetota bacterium]